MKESIREKIALIFLVALIVAAGFAIVSYFAFGRSWSVSATLVDDSVGRMNGYSVLVYQAEEDALTNNQYYLKSFNDDSIDDRTALDLDMNIYDENRRTIATDTIGLKIMSFYPLVNPWGLSKVNMNDVVSLYEDKGADVELLDVSEYGIDSSPKIIKIGDKKNRGILRNWL